MYFLREGYKAMAKNVKNTTSAPVANKPAHNQYFNLDAEKAFFEEVDEEVRNEKFKQLMNKYGGFILLLLIVALSVVVGYEKIMQWRVHKAEQVNVQYVQALTPNPNFEDNIAELESFIATEKGLYKDMARLHIANILLDNNQTERALDYLEKIYQDAEVSDKVKEIATIKLATYRLDASSFSEIEALLSPIVQNTNSAWQQMAQELLAMSAIQNKNFDKARSIYQHLLTDSNISDELRARINDMLASISDIQE